MTNSSAKGPTPLVIAYGRKGHAETKKATFSTDIVRIGSAETNDVFIESKYVEAEAAVLTRQGKNWELFVLSSGEIKVDDQAICSGERTLISRSSELEIFPYSLQIELANSVSLTESSGGPDFESDSQIDSRLLAYPVLAELLVDSSVSQVLVDNLGKILVLRNGHWSSDRKPLTAEEVKEVIQAIDGENLESNRFGGGVKECHSIPQIQELEDGMHFEVIVGLPQGKGFSIRRALNTYWPADENAKGISLLNKCIARRANVLVCGNDAKEVGSLIVEAASLIPVGKLTVGRKGLLERETVFPLNLEGSVEQQISSVLEAIAIGPDHLVLESLSQGVLEPLGLANLSGFKGIIAGAIADSIESVVDCLVYQHCKSSQVSHELGKMLVCQLFDFVVLVGEIGEGMVGIIEIAEPSVVDGNVHINRLLARNPGGDLAKTGRKSGFAKTVRRPNFLSNTKSKKPAN